MFSGEFGNLWIIHSLLLVSQTRESYSSVCDTPSGVIINFMFWWWVHTQTECVPDEPGRTHYFGHKLQNCKSNLPSRMFRLGNSVQLLEVCIKKSFLFMYIPAKANIVLFSWNYSGNLAIFIKLFENISSFISWLTDFPFFCNGKDKTPFLWQNLWIFKLNIVKLGNNHYIYQLTIHKVTEWDIEFSHKKSYNLKLFFLLSSQGDQIEQLFSCFLLQHLDSPQSQCCLNHILWALEV